MKKASSETGPFLHTGRSLKVGCFPLTVLPGSRILNDENKPILSFNNLDKVIAEFSDLNHEQIAACLDYARELSEFEVTV